MLQSFESLWMNELFYCVVFFFFFPEIDLFIFLVLKTTASLTVLSPQSQSVFFHYDSHDHRCSPIQNSLKHCCEAHDIFWGSGLFLLLCNLLFTLQQHAALYSKTEVPGTDMWCFWPNLGVVAAGFSVMPLKRGRGISHCSGKGAKAWKWKWADICAFMGRTRKGEWPWGLHGSRHIWGLQKSNQILDCYPKSSHWHKAKAFEYLLLRW